MLVLEDYGTGEVRKDIPLDAAIEVVQDEITELMESVRAPRHVNIKVVTATPGGPDDTARVAPVDAELDHRKTNRMRIVHRKNSAEL